MKATCPCITTSCCSQFAVPGDPNQKVCSGEDRPPLHRYLQQDGPWPLPDQRRKEGLHGSPQEGPPQGRGQQDHCCQEVDFSNKLLLSELWFLFISTIDIVFLLIGVIGEQWCLFLNFWLNFNEFKLHSWHSNIIIAYGWYLWCLSPLVWLGEVYYFPHRKLILRFGVACRISFKSSFRDIPK